MAKKTKRPKLRPSKQPNEQIDLVKVRFDQNQTVLFIRNGNGEMQAAYLDAPAIKKFKTVQKLFARKHQRVPVLEGANTPKELQEKWDVFVDRDFKPPLFRYRSCTANSFSELANHEIWFSSVTSYNDPFEFEFSVLPISESLEDIELLKSSFRNAGAELPESNEIDALFTDGIRGMTDEERERITGAKPIREKLLSKGVCCFSATNKSILMWSHYADNHRGFVVEYDPRCLPFNEANRVEYSNGLPSFSIQNMIDGIGEAVREIVTTKFTDWKYEQEYRLIHNDDHSNVPHGIAANAIKAIYFGAKCRKGDIETVCRLTHQLGVKFFRARLQKEQFEIEFDEIKYDGSKTIGSYPLLTKNAHQ